MEDPFADFSSPRWWVSSALFGLVLTLIGSRLDKAFSKFSGRFSKKRRQKNEAKKMEFEETVSQLVADGSKEQDYRYRTLRLGQHLTELMLVAVFVLGMGAGLQKTQPTLWVIYGGYFLIFAGSALFYAAMYLANRTTNRDDILDEVVKRRSGPDEAARIRKLP